MASFWIRHPAVYPTMTNTDLWRAPRSGQSVNHFCTSSGLLLELFMSPLTLVRRLRLSSGLFSGSFNLDDCFDRIRLVHGKSSMTLMMNCEQSKPSYMVNWVSLHLRTLALIHLILTIESLVALEKFPTSYLRYLKDRSSLNVNERAFYSTSIASNARLIQSLLLMEWTKMNQALNCAT